jgi:hypothetical protein
MTRKLFAPILGDGTALDNYDSYLELPSGWDPKENARLTLRLKLCLNFVSSTTKGLEPKVARHRDGKTYARDYDGWLFPNQDWDNATLQKSLDLGKRGDSVGGFFLAMAH